MLNFLKQIVFSVDDPLKEAKKRYDVAVAYGGERLISGSDDFTLFLWTPETSKNSVGKCHIIFQSAKKMFY